jgi:hypothetical protein
MKNYASVITLKARILWRRNGVAEFLILPHEWGSFGLLPEKYQKLYTQRRDSEERGSAFSYRSLLKQIDFNAPINLSDRLGFYAWIIMKR